MLTVADVMTSELFILGRTDTLKSARSMMSLARIRHIPIVDEDGVFLGIVTHRDILSAAISRFAELDREVQDEIESGIPINEIMRRDVTIVHPDMSLLDAGKFLLDHKYGCLPVVEDNRLVGILTEADFLKFAIQQLERTVS